MSNIQRIKICIVGSALLLASNLHAESIDGVKILEQEASRARELQKLEYQAKLLEQRARVAKAYQDLKASGGAVPSDFSGMYGMQSNESKGQVVAAPISSQELLQVSVPKLKKMVGRNALFETSAGQVVAHVGMLLPGGYKLLSLDVASGAKLEKNGMIYLATIGW